MSRSHQAARELFLFFSLFSLVFLLVLRSVSPVPIPTLSEAAENAVTPYFVLDAGHGGEDGGAEDGGVVEKDINLSVSLKIADLCTVFGYPARLTRTDDRLLYDAYGDLDDYRGKKKTYDLKNRLRIAEESGAPFFVSIHMNRFPSSSCHGLQVYYSPNAEESRLLAEWIQSNAALVLGDGVTRPIKEAGDSIYLLDRLKIPAVLVECGFLSNEGDRASLVTPAYQNALAAVLFSAAAEVSPSTANS